MRRAANGASRSNYRLYGICRYMADNTYWIVRSSYFTIFRAAEYWKLCTCLSKLILLIVLVVLIIYWKIGQAEMCISKAREPSPGGYKDDEPRCYHNLYQCRKVAWKRNRHRKHTFTYTVEPLFYGRHLLQPPAYYITIHARAKVKQAKALTDVFSSVEPVSCLAHHVARTSIRTLLCTPPRCSANLRSRLCFRSCC